MKTLYSDLVVGKKNMLFGAALFLIFGIIIGVPLTLNFFGMSVMSNEQYQIWKVVHGYGIFIGFINYFFAWTIDRLNLSQREKELSSWSFIITGLFGGVTRMILAATGTLAAFGVYASLGETVFITLGIVLFLLGQLRGPVVNTKQRRMA
jgi:flagellar biosynthesis component FlhA